MRVCVRVFSVGFGPVLDSMSPARSRRSASHAAGTHGWLPQKTGRPGLRRGGVGGYNLHSVPPDSPPDCGTPTTSRLYPFGASFYYVVVVDLPLLRVAVEGSDNPVSLEKPCQASLPPDQQGRHSLGRQPEVQYVA